MGRFRATFYTNKFPGRGSLPLSVSPPSIRALVCIELCGYREVIAKVIHMELPKYREVIKQVVHMELDRYREIMELDLYKKLGRYWHIMELVKTHPNLTYVA